MKTINLLLCCSLFLSLLSCKSTNHGITRQEVIYEFGRNDMDLSGQKSAEAVSTKILGIDFARLFSTSSGNLESTSGGMKITIPIIGTEATPTQVQRYALFNLLSKDPTYDFVVYPRYEQTTSGIPFLKVTTKAKVTARLGKVK